MPCTPGSRPQPARTTVPDWIDQAQALEETQRREALRSALAPLHPAGAKAAPASIDCCGEIAQARRDAIPGVTTCTHCQSARERRGR